MKTVRWLPRAPWRAASVAVVAVGCLLALGILLRVGGEHVTRVLDDVGTAVAAGVATAAAVAAVIRSSGRVRTAWTWISLACLAWTAGEFTWGFFELVQHHSNPFPTIADGFYLTAIPLVAVGVLLLPGAPARPIRRHRAVVDGVIIALGLFLFSWATSLGPAIAGSADTLLAKALSVAYPLTDIAVFTLALLVMSWSPPGARWSIGLIGAGLMAIAVGDSGFGFLEAKGIYSTGNPIDIAYPLGYCLIALGALRPSRAVGPADPLALDQLLSTYRPYPVIIASLAFAAYLQATGGLPWMTFPIMGVILAATAIRGTMLGADIREVMLERAAVDELRRRAQRVQSENLLRLAVQLCRQGLTARDVMQRLSAVDLAETEVHRIVRAADAALAHELADEQEQLESFTPSAVMALPINLYFLLGLTPDATTDAIQRGMREKAKLSHPDMHRGEMAGFPWDRLMGIIIEAARLLQNPETRRAYDTVWLARSRGVEAPDRLGGGRRADWSTRCLWTIAAMGEIENHLETSVAAASANPDAVEETLLAGLRRQLAAYEDGRHEARVAADHLAAQDPGLSRLALMQLARMASLIQTVEASVGGARGGRKAMASEAWQRAGTALLQLRQTHHRFDLSVARHSLGRTLAAAA